jgi:hypothetical protein
MLWLHAKCPRCMTQSDISEMDANKYAWQDQWMSAKIIHEHTRHMMQKAYVNEQDAC